MSIYERLTFRRFVHWLRTVRMRMHRWCGTGLWATFASHAC